MPSDADSLTEPDVDAPSDVAAKPGDANGDVEPQLPATSMGQSSGDASTSAGSAGLNGGSSQEAAAAHDPVDAKIAKAVDADLEKAFDGDDGADRTEEESPFGGDLRLPDEHGYDGEDYGDEEYLDDEAAAEESPFGGDLRLPDEHGYDGDDEHLDEQAQLEYDGDEVLFEGDAEDFELDLGVGTYALDRPEAGDVLVLDDQAQRIPGPRPLRMSRMERRRRVRLQARRVRRIIRHVEPWSVLKISVFFYACLWVIFLVAGFMIWGVAEGSGTVDKLESLIRSLFALETFDFDAAQIFKGYAFGGLALSIAGTAFNVLMCLLFNLISDLTGGLRITMIEEETARPTPPRRRRRRPPSHRRPPPQRR